MHSSKSLSVSVDGEPEFFVSTEGGSQQSLLSVAFFGSVLLEFDVKIEATVFFVVTSWASF